MMPGISAPHTGDVDPDEKNYTPERIVIIARDLLGRPEFRCRAPVRSLHSVVDTATLRAGEANHG